MKLMPSHEELRREIEYDPETGAFTRLRPHRYPVRVKPNKYGYIRINICGHDTSAQRWAWYWMTGRIPRLQVDHINGDRADNRWCNLRLVTPAMNSQNRRRPERGNTSGFLGVSRSKACKSKPWCAQIGIDHMVRNLGCFATPEEAYAAYVAAKRRLHAGCTL